MTFARIFSLFVLLILLQSCSIFHEPKVVKVPNSQQPGEYFVTQAKKNINSDHNQIIALIKSRNPFPKNTNKILNNNAEQISVLLQKIIEGNNVAMAISQMSKERPQDTEKWIYLSLILYPIDAYRIIDELYLDNDVNKSFIETAALMANLEPSRLFTAPAGGDVEYRITPLIHSASLTVYKQTEGAQNSLWYKQTNATHWSAAHELQWEPISGALSGSIVRLEADTDYEIKLELRDSESHFEQKYYSFRTRPNSPPIDPEKIYYLSDIYSGGMLDIEALGIEGNEDGWAKIIGDGVEIIAGEGDRSGINLGGQNYIMLENIVIKGGTHFGIKSLKAHHLWIKGCDISRWGLIPQDYRNGKGYYNENSPSPLNYHSGIYLERSGVVVVEDCSIHSPNAKANHWGNGHPYGPSAMQVIAHHPIEQYRGQHIIRNNRFFGTEDHRYNDVIEGRSNNERYGGFGRDSAIYGNYLAYANDDLIEIDGGQSNVLVYDNHMTQGYCGVSTAPNMIGPSYIFNNFIHKLGDERGKQWTAIKMGGLMSAPGGITNVFENLIVTRRNGISSSKVRGDSTFWVNARNNIIISRFWSRMVGYGVYDSQKYEGSVFENNLIYNMFKKAPHYDAVEEENFLHPDSYEPEIAENIFDVSMQFPMTIAPGFVIPNFSQGGLEKAQNDTQAPPSVVSISLDKSKLGRFDNQDKYGEVYVSDEGDTLTMTGNRWRSVAIDYDLTEDTMLSVDIKMWGDAEIIGVAFETDNRISSERVFRIAGSQDYGNSTYITNMDETEKTIEIAVGQHLTGNIKKLVFILDNDIWVSKNNAKVTYSNIKLHEQTPALSVASENSIRIGIR